MLRQACFLALFSGLVLGIPPRNPERHKVIIIGAGVSGFTAAVTLLEHNVTDVLVLEAADRIGGRTHSVEYGGVYLEKGAEFVHGQGNNSVYKLVNPFDLLTSYKAVMKDDLFLFTNTSGFVFDSSVKPLVDEAYEIFQDEAIQHVNGSVADYFYPKLDELFESKHVDPHVREGLRFFVPLLELSNTLGDDLSDLGAWGFTDNDPIEGDISLKWKPGTKGYRTLYDIISKKFPNPEEEVPVMDKIVLSKEVTRVEQKEGEVMLTCADGSTYLADHVIVTVPLGYLKKHAATMFHPALSTEKTTAIEKLGFGCLGKVFMLFPTKWWANDTRLIAPLFSKQELQDFIANSQHGTWTSRSTGFQQLLNHDRMMYAWFSGETCRHLDTLSDEQVTDGLMELLKKLLGHKYEIPRPESIMRSQWATYPYTLGSYSFRTVESDRLNITNEVLAKPILQGEKPVILFAGEATNRKNSGLVNGALDTGRREAHNLIDYFNKGTK